MTSFRILASVVGAACLAALLPATEAQAQAKQPPACAAISFRPLPAGVGEGEQEAGMYKSRFGQIVVKGTVKGGMAQTYYVTVNGAKPPATDALPAGVASCAATKKLPAPGKAVDACTGDRLRVLIDRSGDKRYLLLYALQGKKWQYCNASVA